MRPQQSILVLDDEPNFSRILEAKLARAGFDVVLASDVASAYGALLSKRSDLILLDLHLRDSHGLDLLPKLRLVAPSSHVLVMTAYEEVGLRERALRAGAVDVLFKPFDLNVLASMVTQILERGAPPERPAVLMSDILAAGRAVVLQGLPDRSSPPSRATIVEEKMETFAVLSKAEVAAAPGAPVLVSITGSDALYEFNSKVVAHEEAKRLSLIKPAVIRRNQRRRHQRKVFQAPVDIEVADGGGAVAQTRASGNSRVSGISVDLSEGGMCVALAEPLQPGTLVSIAIRDGSEPPTPFTSDALVTRVSPVNDMGGVTVYCVGLQFTGLDAVSKPLLERLTSGSP